jgi:NTP pyrophosphatase (non-canonical NTP hydrolase)
MRPKLSSTEIADLMATITTALNAEIDKKGNEIFLSSHEALGIIEEEIHELREAVRGGNFDEIRSELIDIMVAAAWSVGSVDSGEMDWPLKE